MLKFLLIDDNPGDRALIIRQLTTAFPDCKVQVITNSDEFEHALVANTFDLVITDFLLHWSDGITLLQAVKLRYPKCPVIMFTASGSQEIAVEAMKSGLDDYLIKSPNHYIRIPVSISSILKLASERNRAQQLFVDYQNVQQQVKQLEQLNRLKDDFLNMVSHELRTPVTNMKMAIRMLKLVADETQRQRYLKILETECNREAELINNLLDLQRLEATPEARLPRDLSTLQEWLPDLLDGFRDRMQERQQQLQVDLPEFPPFKINHQGLKRIVAELLNNACKYTGAGGQIRLSGSYATATGDSMFEGNHTLTLSVQNQAEIPAVAVPHIFEKFYRVPQSDCWQQGGTGLGLALVREMLLRMDGTITVASQNGWTTFTIHLKDV